MKRTRLLLLTALLVSVVCLPIVYVHYKIKNEASKEDFFFGVSFGLNTSSEAKLLIDKVKGYTNLFVINSWEISTNETALNEICEYAVNSKMHFIVFFDFISHIIYPWHLTWLDTATERWGSKFLGVYLYDEPGGRQIDQGEWDEGETLGNVSDYSEAAKSFVTSIRATWSMQDVKNRGIPVFTSDYAIYWFDYLAGYDAIFVELGWNHSTTKHIALDRGAANVQDKDWGGIIVWTYNNPPYIASGPQILQDMIAAYRAGAKYVIVFNYPKIEGNDYGILEEQHFTAMKTFWDLTCSPQEDPLEKVEGEVAFVLPKDYGWGMRRSDDSIWLPKWDSDDLSPLIWENMNKMIEKHDLRLDIIYNDTTFDFEEKYSEIYFWNDTTN
jgi:hypothetical protein